MNNQKMNWTLVDQARDMSVHWYGAAPSREKMLSLLMEGGALDKYGMPTKFALDNNLVEMGPKAK